MSARVWKWSLPEEARFTLLLPTPAALLTVQLQGESPCLWALVGDGEPAPYRFRWVATGEESRCIGVHRGTVQVGGLVFHLFDDLEDDEQSTPEKAVP